MGEGVIRDRMYPVALGKILFLAITVTPEETPKIAVTLKETPHLHKREVELDFATLAVKGRSSLGNILTKHKIEEDHESKIAFAQVESAP